MAKFTTRVELHSGTYDDYEILHSAMEQQGFSRLISGHNEQYRLPTAEYNLIDDLTGDEVLRRAKKAAAETGREYSVLVTEAVNRKWYNLAAK